LYLTQKQKICNEETTLNKKRDPPKKKKKRSQIQLGQKEETAQQQTKEKFQKQESGSRI
jgi:hypothetical protein